MRPLRTVSLGRAVPHVVTPTTSSSSATETTPIPVYIDPTAKVVKGRDERAWDPQYCIVANRQCARIKVANLSVMYKPSDPSLLMEMTTNVVRNGIVFTGAASNCFNGGDGCDEGIKYSPPGPQRQGTTESRWLGFDN